MMQLFLGVLPILGLLALFVAGVLLVKFIVIRIVRQK
jgi:hypothetical protein